MNVVETITPQWNKSLVMPIGVLYVDWEFPEEGISRITVNVTINTFDPSKGVYLQMYESNLNGAHFYWGLQENQVIFSRFGTTDISDLRVAPGGYYEAASYEGDFVSVRKRYNLKNGNYLLTLRRTDTDSQGEWFGVYMKDERNEEMWIGSLRFPSGPGIERQGGTWLEVYSGVSQLSEVPSWEVDIHSMTADGRTPRHATSVYGTSLWGENSIPTGRIIYDSSTGKIKLQMGTDVLTRPKEGPLY